MMMTEKTDEPVKGQIWEDLSPIDGKKMHEWVEVLHVSASHVIVQRRNGVGRYEREQFGTRFVLVATGDEDQP